MEYIRQCNGIKFNDLVSNNNSVVYCVGQCRIPEGDFAYIEVFFTNGESHSCLCEELGNNSSFSHVRMDMEGNIICVGSSSRMCNDDESSDQEVVGSDAIIAKYSPELDFINYSIYGADNECNHFAFSTIDASNNIICVGSVVGGGSNDASVVIYDSEFNIINEMQYSSINQDVRYAFSAVIADSSDIICIGNILDIKTNEPIGNIVIITDYQFEPIANYESDTIPILTNDVAVDEHGNIYCAGYTESDDICKAALYIYNNTLELISNTAFSIGSYSKYHSIHLYETGQVLCVGMSYQNICESNNHLLALSTIFSIDDELTISTNISQKHHISKKHRYNSNLLCNAMDIDDKGRLIVVGGDTDFDSVFIRF